MERSTTVTGLEEIGDHVLARLRRPDGTDETVPAQYVAGCDGAHSAACESLGIGFLGGTYARLFYVADAAAAGPVLNGELHSTGRRPAAFAWRMDVAMSDVEGSSHVHGPPAEVNGSFVIREFSVEALVVPEPSPPLDRGLTAC